jgi:hypothetical protein
MRKPRWLVCAPAVAVACLLGCTVVQVKPVDPSVVLDRVCIEKNPDVQVADFLDVVRAGFRRHGIETEVVERPAPTSCEFVLRYTALRTWDIDSYLAHADLYIDRSGQTIASATYHLRLGGGYDLTKYRATKTKMDPVIDELLAGTQGQSP